MRGYCFCLVAPLILVLLFSSGYREVLTAATVSKGESGSFINRTASDLYSLQLLLQTYGIGVGLGSNRTSSFLSTLFSNVGVAGTLAYGVFYFKLLANLPKEYEWFKWAVLAFLVNIGIGDRRYNDADVVVSPIACDSIRCGTKGGPPDAEGHEFGARREDSWFMAIGSSSSIDICRARVFQSCGDLSLSLWLRPLLVLRSLLLNESSKAMKRGLN